MSKPVRLALWSLCLTAALLSQAPAQTAAAELDLGVAAYKRAKYDEAIQHFQKAVSLDPTLQQAHLYLGTAFAQQYIPGADTSDNNKMAEQAIAHYKAVLQLDPKNINSLKGIAYLYLQMKKFDNAKEYYRNAIHVDPDDSELYYSVGVIDWTESYQPRMEERVKLNLKPEESFIGYPECWNIRAKNEDHIKEGIEMLTKALTLRRDYDDAMAYMNLLYRERADTECGNQRAHAADLKTADKWVDLTMATKRHKTEAFKIPNQ
jgi:tetratricopeptide (TPR) repeat protein